MSAPLLVLSLMLCLHTRLSVGSHMASGVAQGTRSTTRPYMAEDGYEVFPAFNSSRYKLSPIHVNWGQALTLCDGDGDGSHLLIINSEPEAEAVQELVSRLAGTSMDKAHVGINDFLDEGTWLTIQGELLAAAGYNKWSPGQPNEGTAANCGYVQLDATYADWECSLPRPFVCEKPNL